MTYHEYVWGREISAKDYPFYALIQAAMRQADTDNLEKLKNMFPDVFEKLQVRYNAPRGLLSEEIEEEKKERKIKKKIRL